MAILGVHAITFFNYTILRILIRRKKEKKTIDFFFSFYLLLHKNIYTATLWVAAKYRERFGLQALIHLCSAHHSIKWLNNNNKFQITFALALFGRSVSSEGNNIGEKEKKLIAQEGNSFDA